MAVTRKGKGALLLGAVLAVEVVWASPGRAESIEQLASRADLVCRQEKQNIERFVSTLDQFLLYKVLVRLYKMVLTPGVSQRSSTEGAARPSRTRPSRKDMDLERLRRIESGG